MINLKDLLTPLRKDYQELVKSLPLILLVRGVPEVQARKSRNLLKDFSCLRGSLGRINLRNLRKSLRNLRGLLFLIQFRMRNPQLGMLPLQCLNQECQPILQ